jgi:hypothetical protein
MRGLAFRTAEEWKEEVCGSNVGLAVNLLKALLEI